jgi:hypothetical protein
MEIWILIAFLADIKMGGPMSQEFNGKQACEDAIDRITEMHGTSDNADNIRLPYKDRWGDSWAICVKK